MKQRYSLDKGTKQIIHIMFNTIPARRARRRAGTYTEFDGEVDSAIKAAEKDITLEGFTAKERRNMINKLRESMTYNVRWEDMADIYCCRNVFYRYRKQYCYYVAVHMGMISGKER